MLLCFIHGPPVFSILGCDPPKDEQHNCSSAQLQSLQRYRVDVMAALNASGPRPGV